MTGYKTLGWRVWTVLPDCILRAPYRGSEWASSHISATCEAGADHLPPGDACTCGVFADVTLEASRGRVRHLPVDLALGRSLNESSLRHDAPGSPEIFVQGRVELHGSTVLDVSKSTPELRARRAVIHDLWIPADSPPWLGDGLAQRYSVPVRSDDPSPYGDISVPRSIRRVRTVPGSQRHIDLTPQQFERFLSALEEVALCRAGECRCLTVDPSGLCPLHQER
jgi:hypothetical protein